MSIPNIIIKKLKGQAQGPSFPWIRPWWQPPCSRGELAYYTCS